MPSTCAYAIGVVATALVGAAIAQRPGVFDGSRDLPSISYSTGAVRNRVNDLNARLTDGRTRLAFDSANGYLRSTLEALAVPIESQLLVFSQTSLQSTRIAPANPRALFFNDNVAVGWVRGSDVLEIAAHDDRQGVVFYTLDQTAAGTPRFKRDDTCLACHLTWETLGVPGLQVLSTFPMPDDKNSYARGFVSDHRSPIAQRWGGWYVTGQAPARHLGNVPVLLPRDAAASPGGKPPVLNSLEGQFDTTGYLSLHSDVAALMVLEHQTGMVNRITRLGWEARVAAGQPPAPSGVPQPPVARGTFNGVRDAAMDLVDYLLFVDEEPLPGRIRGSSQFAEMFSARTPRDSQGRSLYQLDLERRLLRYRCSYMIYTPAFDALPAGAKDAAFRRMWEVLSGQVAAAPYDRLPRAERQAIVEILRETKPDLPDYFRAISR